MIFDHSGGVVAIDQKEHEQIYPKPGWVEHDAMEIWTRCVEVIKGGLAKAGIKAIGSGGGWHHEPARDRGRLGSANRQAGAQRHRLAGHPDRRDHQRVGQGWRPGPLPGQGRAAAGDLLLRPEGQVDPRQRSGRSRRRRCREPPLRQHRHLVHLEPHRRTQWRRARHGRDQRQPHDADEPRDPRLGRGHAQDHGHSALHAPGDQGFQRGVRQGRRRPGRHPGRGRPRRPAGGALRPDLLRHRRGQEHLRHRLLHAPQHGHEAGSLQERPAHDHGLQDRQSAGCLRARGLDRHHRRSRPVAA